MEGPTPVSSLLHAATMVNAGVFLLLRCSILLEYSGFSLLVVLLGAITSFIFALVSVFQYDVKKIIAYSTVVSSVICSFHVVYQIIMLQFFIHSIMLFLKHYYF